MAMDLPRLPPVAVLEEMYRTREVRDAKGKTRKLDSEIDAVHAWALYQTVVRLKRKTVVEIGMAYGGSTLSILAGLVENGHGRLISIDPGQASQWSNIGLENVRRSGLAEQHELRQAPSFLALPSLLKNDTRVDLAYIDGWHTFDYTLLDFFYLDKMAPEGAVIGFNDCGYPAIRKVLYYVRTHRKYRSFDVGLKPNTKGRNIAYTAARTALGLGREDQYFQKVEDWEPDWNFFKNF